MKEGAIIKEEVDKGKGKRRVRVREFEGKTQIPPGNIHSRESENKRVATQMKGIEDLCMKYDRILLLKYQLGRENR